MSASPFSQRAVRLAIHDSMASLAKELLIVQRRMAATVDLIAIEEMERAA